MKWAKSTYSNIPFSMLNFLSGKIYIGVIFEVVRYVCLSGCPTSTMSGFIVGYMSYVTHIPNILNFRWRCSVPLF